MTEHPSDEETLSLAEALESAIDGLVYSSEGDLPFTLVHWLGAGGEGVPDAYEIARLAGANDDDPVEERPVTEFLARHTERSDAYDERAQAIRPRYEALESLLRTQVQDARFIRIGRQVVRCLVVGADDEGNLVGVETVASET